MRKELLQAWQNDCMIQKASIYGNPFVGLFIRSNEKICLTGPSIDEKIIRIVEKFAIPIKVSMAESDLIGLFCTMNSNGLILDRLTTDKEIESIKNKFRELSMDMNIYKMKTNFSPGNNICVNDFGGIINKNINKKEVKAIEETLSIEILPMSIGEFSTVGGVVFTTNKFFIACPKINEDEFKNLRDILRVDGYAGTLNSGFPFPSIAIAGNTKGCIVGNLTTGFEIYRLNEYW
jgi:putative translation initiation factor eIF-6